MFNQINEDLKEALKNGDKFKLSVLRMLKSSLQTEQIAKKHELTDEECIAVIKKQVKVRTSSLEEYLSYNRQDLVDNLQKEIDLLKTYLPEELSEDEIENIIADIFSTLHPEGMKDMGKVMKEATARMASRADMSIVSKIIKEKLNN